ncbi:DUF5958 family protein [Fulvivirga ulvae]|uniref:DUF5958 family protein n=1 Tax=Fulvivirga ulvae TaxID=2904245 RepID=UPI001F2044C1|nr:DUF5958 family protein [Fulvivirga ulvae]UII34132.1 DUF5958 family protein [Fulvivirga ulvae]
MPEKLERFSLQSLSTLFIEMLNTEKEITLNKYGQGLVDPKVLVDEFSSFGLSEKRSYLKEIIALIQQSKPQEEDIRSAIVESKLKPTFTPCVLLAKGITSHLLQRIAELPDYELNKALKLLLGLFKVSYQRRFQAEKNNPDKWWYWDLSDERNVEKVLKKYLD